jgi:hypothetical protein
MKLVVSLSLLVAASGHRILTNPSSYNGNSANQAKPCPAKQDGYTPTEVKDATPIPFTWTNDHGGDNWVKVVRSENEAQLETLAVDDPLVVFYQNYGNAASGSVTIDSPGLYTAQYGWSGYRNCVQLDVKGTAVAAPLNGGCSGSGSTDTCRITSGVNSQCDATDGSCRCIPGYYIDKNNVCRDPADTTQATCSSYCTDAMAMCTGDNKIFNTYEGCVATCATYEQGTVDEPKENSLECRFYHLHVEGGDVEHCPHASQAGGGKCTGTYQFIPGAALTVFGDGSLTQEGLTSLVNAQLAAAGSTATVNSVEFGNGQNEFQVLLKFQSQSDADKFLAESGPAYEAAQAVDSDPSVVGVNVEEPDKMDVAAAGSVVAGATTFAAVMFAL